ncbi:hypothetical protein QTG54_015653 [Skeletonema marinoi]|uniref:Uncharacterized protein n=1 Tax=Skeletonema marinoi TaxID=267567 RepID=A0AAD8XUB0_9STRA|nr:hypothetical protein QTG54_015653 [Skeletonema marinoi]
MHAEEKQLHSNQGGGQYSKDNWRHEADDKAMRRKTTVRMYELLIAEFMKNDKYSVEWKRKLPLLVRRLELMHYCKSSSKEVYMDVCPKKMMKQLKTLVRDIYMEKRQTQMSGNV